MSVVVLCFSNANSLPLSLRAGSTPVRGVVDTGSPFLTMVGVARVELSFDSRLERRYGFKWLKTGFIKQLVSNS